MKKIEFLSHFFLNFETGLLFIILSVFLVLLLFRKHYFSLFDPFLFYLFLSSISYGVAIYLYYFDFMSDYYFSSFMLTQLAFFFGLYCVRPTFKKFNSKNTNNDAFFSGMALLLYYGAIFFYIPLQLYSFSVVGFPIFLESRLEAYIGGSGFGVVKRFIEVFSVVVVALAFCRLMVLQKRNLLRKTFDYSILVFCVFSAVVSGSKAAVLIIIFIFVIVLFYVRRQAFPMKDSLKLLSYIFMFALPAAFYTISVQNQTTDWFAITLSFLTRFVNHGDAFYMSYPNGVIDQLQQAPWWKALFKDFLGLTRIYSWSDLPTSMGLQITRYHYDTELIQGPNSRHNIFGLFYFGYYISIFFSFLLGLLVNALRFKLLMILPYNAVSMVVYVTFVLVAVLIEQDPTLAFSRFISIVILLLPFVMFVYFLRAFFRRQII